MEAALVFNRILSVASDPADATVSVALGTEDNQGLQINFSRPALGPLMAALAASAAELDAARPRREVDADTALTAHAVWLSRDAEGRPMLVFELQGGIMLPLILQGEDLSGLAAEMTLLSAKPS